MKTLSEHNQEREAERQRREADREAYLAALQSFLDEVQGGSTPVYVPTDPEDTTNYAAERGRLRGLLASKQASMLGLACDHCGTPLVVTGYEATASRRSVGCPGCGWVGSVEI